MTPTDQWSLLAVPSGRMKRGITIEGRLRGVEATVRFDLLLDEHNRRSIYRIGAVHDPYLLRELAELPGTEWIHLHELTPELVNIARQYPALVETQLDARGTWIRRRLAPPIFPTHVDVYAQRPRQGLEWAGRFAGYASRTLHLPELPKGSDQLALECAYFGVGLSVSFPTDTNVVSPAPFLPERFSFASWHFAEMVYARWLASDAKAAWNQDAPRYQDPGELLPSDQSW